jgi:hypothetical protein
MQWLNLKAKNFKVLQSTSVSLVQTLNFIQNGASNQKDTTPQLHLGPSLSKLLFSLNFSVKSAMTSATTVTRSATTPASADPAGKRDAL